MVLLLVGAPVLALLLAGFHLRSRDHIEPPIYVTPYHLKQLYYGSVDMDDYDGDGDLDLLLTGWSEVRPFTRVYRLDDSVYFEAEGDDVFRYMFKVYNNTEAIVNHVWRGAAKWADIDGDGDLDFALTGIARVDVEVNQTEEQIISETYINVAINDTARILIQDASLSPKLYNGVMAWGDYDGDGDPDLLHTGLATLEPPFEARTVLFRNDGGILRDSGIELPPLALGDAAWADIDGDGDHDLAMLGYDPGGGTSVPQFYSAVLRNDAGVFTELPVSLPEMAFGSVDWGDFDNDGDPDLLASGARWDPHIMRGSLVVLRNDGNGSFTEVQTGLPGIMQGDARWIDYDADGHLDIILTGARHAGGRTEHEVADRLIGGVYLNSTGGFYRELLLGGLEFSRITTGDYNGDGDVDFVFVGRSSDGVSTTGFYMNRLVEEKIPPGFFPR